MSTAKSFDSTEDDILDFVFALNVLHPLEVILWKKSNVSNEEVLILFKQNSSTCVNWT